MKNSEETAKSVNYKIFSHKNPSLYIDICLDELDYYKEIVQSEFKT